MSDHDPIDRAYAQAEAVLDDEAARAARRARVLGAVAGDAGAAAAVSSPPKRRIFPAAGWLAAASVAGVSVLVAVQLSTPPVVERPSSEAETPVVVAPAPAPAAAPAPTPAPTLEAAPPAPNEPPQARIAPPAEKADAAPSPFPARLGRTTGAPAAAPPAAVAPPAAPPVADSGVEALIVTGQRREESLRPLPRSAPFDSTAAQAPSAAPAPTGDRTARLHGAAAAGRVDELAALLAQGVPVDAMDRDGETALMKAVQANRPAAAALLRRHGASLDRPNRAGVSARDMAAAIDDPDLNRALGLDP